MTHIRHWRILHPGSLIVEAPIFTRQALDLLSDDEYRRLQLGSYWTARHQRLLMLLIYPKSARDALRPEQLKALRKIVA